MRYDTKRFVIRYVYITHTHAERCTHCTKQHREPKWKIYIHIFIYTSFNQRHKKLELCWMNVRLVSIYQVCVRTHIGEFSFDYGKKRASARARKRKRVNNVQCNDQNEARMVVRGWEKDWWCGLFLSVVCRFFSFGHIISFTHAFRSVRSVSFSSSSPHRRFMKSYGKEKYFKVPLNTRCM